MQGKAKASQEKQGKQPKHSQTLPPPSKPSQNHPKTFPKQPKIHPKSLLELILAPRTRKSAPRTPQERTKRPQERPKEAQEPPEPLPNDAQDSPKTIFWTILDRWFSHSKIALIFYACFLDFLVIFKSSTLTKHRVGARFFKIGVFALSSKIDQKHVDFRSPKSVKHR